MTDIVKERPEELRFKESHLRIAENEIGAVRSEQINPVSESGLTPLEEPYRSGA